MMRQVPPGRAPGERAPALPKGQISLNELYYTIQGECRFQGTPTVFVRTSHCLLRCTWCDSKYTFYQGTPRSTQDVIAEIASYPTQHVCLTGGEPLSQPESVELTRQLAENGYTIEVETSGAEDIAPLNALPPSLRQRVTINLDIKCPASAMTAFNRWENLAQLQRHDQLKFIIQDRDDYEYAKDVLRRHEIPCVIYLHPVWKKLEPSQLADWVKADGLPVRVGVQLHKYIWGDVRGV